MIYFKEKYKRNLWWAQTRTREYKYLHEKFICQTYCSFFLERVEARGRSNQAAARWSFDLNFTFLFFLFLLSFSPPLIESLTLLEPLMRHIQFHPLVTLLLAHESRGSRSLNLLFLRSLGARIGRFDPLDLQVIGLWGSLSLWFCYSSWLVSLILDVSFYDYRWVGHEGFGWGMDGFGRDRSCFSFGWRDCTCYAGCSAGKDRGFECQLYMLVKAHFSSPMSLVASMLHEAYFWLLDDFFSFHLVAITSLIALCLIEGVDLISTWHNLFIWWLKKRKKEKKWEEKGMACKILLWFISYGN